MLTPPLSWLGEDWRSGFSPPHQPFKFLFASLKRRLLPCLGVKHSLNPCPVPPHPQQCISFKSFFGPWVFELENFLFPIPLFCLAPFCPLLLLLWFVIGYMRYAVCCMIASYGGSELLAFGCVPISTTADFALTSETPPPSVSVLAFLAAITSLLY